MEPTIMSVQLILIFWQLRRVTFSPLTLKLQSLNSSYFDVTELADKQS